MRKISKRLAISLAIIGGCALMALFVVAATAAVLMLLVLASVAGPLWVLTRGPGRLGARVLSFRRGRNDGVIDI